MRLFSTLPSPISLFLSFAFLTFFFAPDVSAQKKLLVKYKTNKNVSFAQSSVEKIYPLKVIKPESIPWNVFTLDRNANVEKVLEQLREDPNVLYAEEDFQVEGFGNPNDPLFNEQWMYSKRHPNGGNTGLDFGFTNAWNRHRPKKEVVVGVLDSGIDWDHPDLVNNIWQNLGEDADGDGRVLEYIGGKWVFDPGDANGIDDDGNGYEDDFIGWDFVQNDNDPSDDNMFGHGTHVAGIIGAEHDNGIGITGAAVSVALMPLKFLDAQSSGYISDAISALDYAVQMGADISNHSWGGQAYSEALYDAIHAAMKEDHLTIAAAGNNYGADNDINPMYPASYDLHNIISVTAINPDGELTSFSNIGAITVDIASPGYGIQSTLPDGEYGLLSGTSMAAPLVAGAAALLMAEDPDLNCDELKEKIIKGAKKTTDLLGKVKSAGYLDVKKAYQYNPNNNCEVSPLFATKSQVICPGTRLITENISEGAKSYRWFINGQRVSNKKNLRYKVPASLPGSPAFVTVSLVAKKGNCTETFSKKMEVVYAPEIAIEDVSRCGEAAYVEVANTRGIAQYRWKNGNGRVVGRESSISIRNSGNYTLEVRNSCGVRASDAFSVQLTGSCVWPGDITADGTVNAQDFLAWGLASGRSGPARPTVSTEYEAQYAPDDWARSFPNRFDLAPGVNLKHADANGDGRINTLDLRPIANQLRQECENGDVVQGSPVSLAISTNQQALTNGGELELDISLDGYNGADIEDAYGLIFSVSFNMPLGSTPELDLQNSWMGTKNQDMRGWFVPTERDPNAGDPYCGYVAITRTDRQGITGGGRVGGLLGVIIIVDDLSPGGLSALSEIRTLGVSVSDAQLVTKSGKLIRVGTSSASSSLQIPIVQEEDRALFELSEPNISHISVFPNPFSHQLILEAEVENDKETLLVIRDLQGKEVVRENMSLQAGFNEKVLDLNHLASGLYMAEILADNQIISVSKLIKQ